MAMHTRVGLGCCCGLLLPLAAGQGAHRQQPRSTLSNEFVCTHLTTTRISSNDPHRQPAPYALGASGREPSRFGDEALRRRCPEPYCSERALDHVRRA